MIEIIKKLKNLKLTEQEIGEMMLHLLEYYENENYDIENEERIKKYAFDMIIVKYVDKYKKTQKTNSENGKKGGRPRKEKK